MNKNVYSVIALFSLLTVVGLAQTESKTAVPASTNQSTLVVLNDSLKLSDFAWRDRWEMHNGTASLITQESDSLGFALQGEGGSVQIRRELAIPQDAVSAYIVIGIEKVSGSAWFKDIGVTAQ